MFPYKFLRDSQTGERYVETNLTKALLLETPSLNKGNAFTEEERLEFGLDGLLPPFSESFETQLSKLKAIFFDKKGDIEKFILLRNLRDSNETLFYRFVQENLKETIPLLNNKSLALKHYHDIYRKPRGIFISYSNKDKIDRIIENIDLPDVQLVIVSDGSKTELGDLGAYGLSGPIETSSLYTLCAGIHPSVILPVMLDSGTDNESTLKDPLYPGWKHRKIQGKDYQDFLSSFVQAIRRHYPNALIHWEGFSRDRAFFIEEQLRPSFCTFVEEIQMTAGTAVAGILTALKIKEVRLRDQQIAIVGAGSAGIGIANLIVLAMIAEGLSEKEAREHLWLFDKNGLLIKDQEPFKPPQLPFAQPPEKFQDWGITLPQQVHLQTVIDKIKPSILIGTSRQPNIFKERLIQTISKYTKYPIIFTLSTSQNCIEATPQELIDWTEGKAFLATGMHLDPINHSGCKFQLAEAHNYQIYSGYVLGILSSKAKLITDNMLLAATKTLSTLANAVPYDMSSLYPPLETISQTSQKIALAVGLQAQKDGAAKVTSPEDLQKAIEDNTWSPKYPKLVSKR